MENKGPVKLILEHQKEEMKRCKENPYYFATTYLTINGNSFTTRMNEKEFNSYFNHFYAYKEKFKK